MNAVSLVGTIVAVDPTSGTSQTRFQLAVPRRERGGFPAPGVVYLDCVVSNADLDLYPGEVAIGAVVGVAGRLDVDSQHGAAGWAETHTVLVDQLDILSEASS